MLLEEQAVSIISVQSSLMQDWKNASDRSMIPLTFQKRKRFRPNTDAFLVLNFGVLMMAKSKYNVTKNLRLGGSVNFVQASLGAEKTLKGIFTQGEVVSVYDAICHLIGKELNFRKEGTGWYKPTIEGMSSITGALTFLHMILTGKVQPCGKFKDVVPAWRLSSPRLPVVCFDLLIPYGILYCTHTMGFEPCSADPCTSEHPKFFRLRLDRWDCSRNYNFPVIVGGPQDDIEVREAVLLVFLRT